MLVAVGVLAAVAIAVVPSDVTMSCGGFGPVLDESDNAVEFVVESPKLKVPFPVIALVTSTLYHVPDVTGPELPSFAPNGGAFEYVIVVSPQVVSATEQTSNPVDWELLA